MIDAATIDAAFIAADVIAADADARCSIRRTRVPRVGPAMCAAEAKRAAELRGRRCGARHLRSVELHVVAQLARARRLAREVPRDGAGLTNHCAAPLLEPAHSAAVAAVAGAPRECAAVVRGGTEGAAAGGASGRNNLDRGRVEAPPVSQRATAEARGHAASGNGRRREAARQSLLLRLGWQLQQPKRRCPHSVRPRRAAHHLLVREQKR
mmetsp:Transcript_24370/g.56647  ORF Transcript_24370/g.56647 Transcript_24370/m.56647 type:complete len:210 (-) Transcript_24370:1194-1823(-)